MTLPPELCEKIIAHLGSKDLWNKIWRCDEAPKTYKNIIESEMISQILRGELTIDVLFHKKNSSIDFSARFFLTCFQRQHWDYLFQFVVLLNTNRVLEFAKVVEKELLILRNYVHNEMLCYFIRDHNLNFSIDFANLNEFCKFFIYFELYSQISNNVLENKFYNNIQIADITAFIDFLPAGDTLEARCEAYNEITISEIVPFMKMVEKCLSNIFTFEKIKKFQVASYFYNFFLFENQLEMILSDRIDEFEWREICLF